MKFLLAAMFATVLVLPKAVWGAESVTLNDCITIALQKSEAVRAAGIDAEIAIHDRDAIFWRFFPTIKTGAAYLGLQYQPEKESISIAFPDFKIPFATPTTLSASIEYPNQLRMFGIVAVQPLSQLWQIANGYKAKDVVAEIETIKRALTRDQLAAKTAEYFYTYLMLEQVESALQDSEKQLQRYKATAQSFVDTQLTDTRPVLKIEIGQVQIEKELAATRGGLVTVKAALAALLDKARDDFTLKPEEPDGPCVLNEERLLDLQQSRRHEFAMLDKRNQALNYAKRAAVQALIPSLVFTAGYMYNWDADVRSDSVSLSVLDRTITSKWDVNAFLPKGTVFVGGVLTWDIGFDWARNYHTYMKASGEADKSRIEADGSRKLMRVQAIKLHSELQVKGRDIDLAKAEIKAAAENLRIEEDKFNQALTTETNLLAAHLQLRLAKTALIAARYQYRIAMHQMAATTGIPIETLLGK